MKPRSNNSPINRLAGLWLSQVSAPVSETEKVQVSAPGGANLSAMAKASPVSCSRLTSKGWAINAFPDPQGVERVDVDPWTGLRVPAGAKTVSELFLSGSAPRLTAGGSGGVCGDQVLQKVGVESRSATWLAADRDWVARAQAQG